MRKIELVIISILVIILFSFSGLSTEWDYSGENYTLTNTNLPTGIATDGSSFWVSDRGIVAVIEFDSSFNYVSNFSVADRESSPSGIYYFDSFLYVIGYGSDIVLKYNTSGDYQGVNYSIGAIDTIPRGLCFDDPFRWIVGSQHDNASKVNESFHSLGINIYTSINTTNPTACDVVSSRYYIADSIADRILVYNSSLDFVEVGDVYSVLGSQSISGITHVNAKWYLLTLLDKKVNVFEGVAPADTCTYGGSGSWDITDNCSLSTNTDIGANQININDDSVTVTIESNITAASLYKIDGAKIYIPSGTDNKLYIT